MMVDMPLNPIQPTDIYLIYMYKEDLALNNLRWLICHKTKTHQLIYISYIYIKRIWHLNNLQWLICHKTQSHQLIYISYICIKRIWHLNNLQWLIYHRTKPNQIDPIQDSKFRRKVFAIANVLDCDIVVIYNSLCLLPCLVACYL